MVLTVWDFLVRVQVFVHIHGEIHHVSVAEEVQLSLKKFLLIVDLLQIKTQVYMTSCLEKYTLMIKTDVQKLKATN